jgi:hypothetical protein
MNKFSTLFTLLILTFEIAFAGQIINKSSGKPVEYVNIGIPGKNIGTVSNDQGFYVFRPEGVDDETIVRLSCIGFQTMDISLGKFLSMDKIEMTEIAYPLHEAIVLPSTFVKKVLGVKTTSTAAQAGFTNNSLGYEMGIMMPVRKRAKINSIILNIASNTYDTVFYRVNIYEVKNLKKREFVNVLKEPLYLTIIKNQVKKTITFDVSQRQILVTGKFLVTLEHVKNLGTGGLFFCSQIGPLSWYRKTSQGEWGSAPIGVSISVEALVEK